MTLVVYNIHQVYDINGNTCLAGNSGVNDHYLKGLGVFRAFCPAQDLMLSHSYNMRLYQLKPDYIVQARDVRLRGGKEVN